MNSFLVISPEVSEALANKKPVVALESTIITHGMPYPANMQTALLIEETVRENGAIPATIAVIDGVIRVGLSHEDIKKLAQGEADAIKLSRKDLAYVLAAQKTGSTTVAATMICAHLAGIQVFVTGGIGGVHRAGESTFDISADLQELAKTPVTVVCAGAKAILDIGRSLEVLETLGVPIVGYQTKRFPAFYYADSGYELDYGVEDLAVVARMMHKQADLGLEAGILLACPIPQEDALEKALIEDAISEALKDAQEANIQGKAVTPYLLKRVAEKTQGDSLRANIALIKNNAKIGALLAQAVLA